MSSQVKTAIVTGASQGIGAGIVKGFVERGFNVVANSRKVTQSTEVAASDHVALVDGDIGEPATAARIVETALSRFKSIDALVNNAGIFFTKPFTDYTAEDFKSLVSTNVEGFLSGVARRQWEAGLDIGLIYAGAVTSEPDARADLAPRLAWRDQTIRLVSEAVRPRLRDELSQDDAMAIISRADDPRGLPRSRPRPRLDARPLSTVGRAHAHRAAAHQPGTTEAASCPAVSELRKTGGKLSRPRPQVDVNPIRCWPPPPLDQPMATAGL